MSIHKYLTISSSYISQLSFFCGHGPECDIFESDALFSKALEVKKPHTTLHYGFYFQNINLFQNFDKHFAVVGITEHFNESIRVLEKHLPKYFKGVQQVILDEPGIFHTNTNGFKPKVSRAIKSVLAANMTREIDFYLYAKQRLLRQYLSLHNQ